MFRLIRAVKLLARDGRIPRPLRSLAAVGLLPIPGPVDEAVLLVVGLLLYVAYREPLRDAWSRAAGPKPFPTELGAPSATLPPTSRLYTLVVSRRLAEPPPAAEG